MNQHVYQRRPVGDSAIPTIIFALLIINGLLFALQQSPDFFQFLFRKFALWPIAATFPNPEFGMWQVMTYGFLHGDLMHIAFNMFMLWMFGREIELMLGAQRFFIYYMTCVIGAAAIQLVVAHIQGGIYPTVGASGGVYGLLLAYGMAFPNRMIMLMFPPIPMKAKYMVIMFGALELYLGLSGRAPGVANFAHLGGMLFGYLLIQHWRANPRRRN